MKKSPMRFSSGKEKRTLLEFICIIPEHLHAVGEHNGIGIILLYPFCEALFTAAQIHSDYILRHQGEETGDGSAVGILQHQNGAGSAIGIIVEIIVSVRP